MVCARSQLSRLSRVALAPEEGEEEAVAVAVAVEEEEGGEAVWAISTDQVSAAGTRREGIQLIPCGAPCSHWSVAVLLRCELLSSS